MECVKFPTESTQKRSRSPTYRTPRFSKTVAGILWLGATLTSAAQADLETSHLSPILYFRSAAEEASARAELHARIAAETQALAAAPVPSLPRELDRAESLIADLQTHAAYWKVQTLEDVQDQPAKRTRDDVDADQTVLEAAMKARLRRLSPTEVSSLGRYAYLAQTAQRDAAHALSPDTERYRGAIVPPAMNSFADAYDMLEAPLTRPKQIGAADPMARRAALAAWNEASDKAAPQEATLLGAIVELENRDAVAQGYPDAAARKYQELGLSENLVDRTLAAVQAEAPTYRHYQEVLAHHATKVLRVSPVFSTELDLASAHAPPLSLADARRLILSALKPLGTEYTKRFAALVDPANGRLDLAGGPHRAEAGTSLVAYDAPTALYYSGFDGSLRDVSKIAHEGGHAIHRELMNNAGIPIYERSGPNYLFEGFAIFNELLLLDHATETAKTRVEKQNALEQLLSKISLELFVSAEETSFEKSLYAGGLGEPMLDRARIDSLYRTSIAPYEYFPATDVGQSRRWMRKSLLFEDPLYLVNYLYASVIATALYGKIHSDPDFAKNYESLLGHGFPSDPQTILASFGIRLDDPSLVKPAADLLKEKTQELEQLYAQE